MTAYTITSPDDIDPALWSSIVSAGDVITLRTGAGYRHIPVGIPLCSGCDGALDDEGFCEACQEPAHWRDTIRQALLAPRSGITAKPCQFRSPEELTDDIHRIAGGRL